MRGSTRRRFLGLAGAAAVSGSAKTKPSSGRPPNFVVILADDLGWGDLRCYGSKRNETPELDRMAAEGARFTGAYATAPVCAPTRASLLTGRYPSGTDWRSTRRRMRESHDPRGRQQSV